MMESRRISYGEKVEVHSLIMYTLSLFSLLGIILLAYYHIMKVYKAYTQHPDQSQRTVPESNH